MYCPNCGKEEKDNLKFCSNCGYDLKNNSNKTNNNNNIPLILAIISILTVLFPILSIPCAIISIIKLKNNDNKTLTIIIDIISIILSILYITMIVLITKYAFNFIKDKLPNNNYQFKYNDNEDYFDNREEDFDISNNKWIKEDDNQILNLMNNGNYEWYIDQNNYQKGEYETYKGIEAINYIANNLDEYSISPKEQWEEFANDINLSNYYLLILNQKELITDNNSKIQEDKIIYYGFYDNNKKTLSLINIKDNDKITFKLDETNINDEKENSEDSNL